MKKFPNILILIVLFGFSGFGIEYCLRSAPDLDVNSISRICVDFASLNINQLKSFNFLNALEEESEPEKVIIFSAEISNFTCYTILTKSIYSPIYSYFLNVVLFESDSSPPIIC